MFNKDDKQALSAGNLVGSHAMTHSATRSDFGIYASFFNRGYLAYLFAFICSWIKMQMATGHATTREIFEEDIKQQREYEEEA